MWYLVAAVVGCPLVWWVSIRWFHRTTPLIPPVAPAPSTPAEQGRWAQAWIEAQQDRQHRRDHATNTRWTRLTVTLYLVAVAMMWQASAVDYVTCQTRTERSEEVRRAITTAVDEVAEYASLDPPDRDLVTSRVETRVRSELPPPDC